ncbi:hypothetical protein X772_31470 [Mesorhizobium sp. LSJC280B00]|nr:hypothetical protein X772_31470 [Mesorhizobium sp. LSJC280B00]
MMDARSRLLADRVVVIMQADDQRRTANYSAARQNWHKAMSHAASGNSHS